MPIIDARTVATGHRIEADVCIIGAGAAGLAIASEFFTNKERVVLLELLDDSDRSYREVGEELGMSESAVKVAVHRLKQRMGDILREMASSTVAEPSRVDDEVRHLLETASRR